MRRAVKSAGKYDLRVGVTKANNYAIVQFSLDGRRVGEPVDLYNADGTIVRPVSLGIHQLSAGDHVLQVEITGANRKAIQHFAVGLDYIDCVPQ